MPARLAPLLTLLLLGAAPSASALEPPAEPTGGAPAPSAPDVVPADPRVGLLTPLPDHGGVPPIIARRDAPDEQTLTFRAAARAYAKQIRDQAHALGRIRVASIRAEGIRRLGEFVDPASFRPLLQELAGEHDDVRLAVLDHLSAQGNAGQAALAWATIHDADAAIRHEALQRMTAPAGRPVLQVIDRSLRSPVHATANQAGLLAGALGVVDAIPLLMFAQVSQDAPDEQGDLAWIAIQTQQPFVAGVQAVVGDQSGAFQPITGIVNEGVVLRVQDAVVIVYRTLVHRALVRLSTDAFGESTAHLGYDPDAWWRWYNEEYVPYRNEQARIEALGREAP